MFVDCRFTHCWKISIGRHLIITLAWLYIYVYIHRQLCVFVYVVKRVREVVSLTCFKSDFLWFLLVCKGIIFLLLYFPSPLSCFTYTFLLFCLSALFILSLYFLKSVFSLYCDIHFLIVLSIFYYQLLEYFLFALSVRFSLHFVSSLSYLFSHFVIFIFMHCFLFSNFNLSPFWKLS